MTATVTPKPAATPTPDLAAAAIVSADFECGDHDDIKVVYRAQAATDGREFWVFAQPQGQLNYYPSDSPVPREGTEYSAKVVTGPAREYDVDLMLLSRSGADEVKQYIAKRKIDGKWQIGLDELPDETVCVDETLVARTCSSRFDTPAPTAAGATPKPKSR
jgi:hypothetical protein